jgi:WD40 repeat protein
LQLEGERLLTGSHDRTIKQWDLSKLHAKNDRLTNRRGRHATKENNTVNTETELDTASTDDMNTSDTAGKLNEDNMAENKPHRRHRKNKIIQDAAQHSDEPAGDPCLVNTFIGHTDTVTCLHFDANCLVRL